MYYTFIDKHHTGIPWITFVHPLKQALVTQLVKEVPAWVDYLIIFGSSVTPNCYAHSDLDICVIGKPTEPISNLFPCLDHEEKDIIFKTSIHDLRASLDAQPSGIISDILSKGVVIYAHEKNLNPTG